MGNVRRDFEIAHACAKDRFLCIWVDGRTTESREKIGAQEISLTHAILLRDLPSRLLAPIDFGFLMMPVAEHVGIG